MLKSTKRLIFLALGILTIVLAILGMVLPILPTTPFLLLSAYFFSQSNEKLHQWLLDHPVFGPIIGDWERHKVIRLKAKIISTILIIALYSYTLIFVDVANWIKIIVFITGVLVLGFIISRPSSPKDTNA